MAQGQELKNYFVLVGGRTEPIKVQAHSHVHDPENYQIKLCRDNELVAELNGVESWWSEDIRRSITV